jgi:hypothetical protein
MFQEDYCLFSSLEGQWSFIWRNLNPFYTRVICGVFEIGTQLWFSKDAPFFFFISKALGTLF